MKTRSEILHLKSNVALLKQIFEYVESKLSPSCVEIAVNVVRSDPTKKGC